MRKRDRENRGSRGRKTNSEYRKRTGTESKQRKVPEIKRDAIECEGGRETEKGGEVEGERQMTNTDMRTGTERQRKVQR